MGLTKQFPSSNELFRDWYYRVRGYYPDTGTVGMWAALDVVESALYRAATSPRSVINGHLQADAVLAALRRSDIRTPFGRVAFDTNNVNNGINSVMAQVLPSSNTSEIVYPSGLETASFVYPMPTWNERIYTWHLVSESTQKKSAVAVAAVCTALLLAVSVTVTYHRRGAKLLYYLNCLLSNFTLSRVYVTCA